MLSLIAGVLIGLLAAHFYASRQAARRRVQKWFDARPGWWLTAVAVAYWSLSLVFALLLTQGKP